MCPNLSSLILHEYVVEKYSFRDLSGLVEAKISFCLHSLSLCDSFSSAERTNWKWKQIMKWRQVLKWTEALKSMHHVKYLVLRNRMPTMVCSALFSAGFCFYNLKWLHLQTKYSKRHMLAIEAYLELAPNLETLVLEYFDDEEDEEHRDDDNKDEEDVLEQKVKALLDLPLQLKIPNLKQVRMRNFSATIEEAVFVTYLILHGAVLEKIVLVSPMMEETLSPQSVMRSSLDPSHDFTSLDLV